MTTCAIDFETRSTVELKRSGVYPYARHHDTAIWCMAWAFDDEDPALWWEGQSFPERLAAHIAGGGELRAWNAAFERVMWRDCAIPKYGFPVVRDGQWWCTMAEAMAMALPRSLEHAAQVLRLPIQKDMAGNRLSKQMCRPRRFDEDTGALIWWDDDARKAKLGAYCRQDVRAERAVALRVRRLGDRERAIYLLDQRVNDRGVALDVELASKARDLADQEIARQNDRLRAATSGRVTEVTKVAQLKAWLAGQGVDAPSLAKKALDELLSDGILSDDVRTALESRAEAAKSSVAKLDAMLDCVGRDGRMRGLFLYHGASTGRWAGKLVQPQNFPRGLDVADVEDLIPSVLDGSFAPPDGVTTMQTLSAMLRSMMVAGRGRELFAADFAQIEARVLAWLANETVMLAQFREKRPIYQEMGEVIYRRKVVKPSPEYQLSKNTVLGCGFGMGWKKFMATTGADQETAERAVKAYRTTYAAIPIFWDQLNAAAIAAVEHENAKQVVGRIAFLRRGGYLWAILPAGRALAYAAPKVVLRPMPWDETDLRPAVEFSGVNAVTRKWERLALYGGLITENVVQAVARDLLADALLRAERAGFAVVLHAHDEVVSEVPDGADFDRFLALVTEVPPWAAGCPVDGEGWYGLRYRK